MYENHLPPLTSLVRDDQASDNPLVLPAMDQVAVGTAFGDFVAGGVNVPAGGVNNAANTWVGIAPGETTVPAVATSKYQTMPLWIWW